MGALGPPGWRFRLLGTIRHGPASGRVMEMRKPAFAVFGIVMACLAAGGLGACGGSSSPAAGTVAPPAATAVPTHQGAAAPASATTTTGATATPTSALPTDLALQFHELQEVDDSQFPPDLALTVG